MFYDALTLNNWLELIMFIKRDSCEQEVGPMHRVGLNPTYKVNKEAKLKLL